MATVTSQAPGLQDKLKEQVGVSVKDALERTTSILSNLHRVQSYLDIIRTMNSPSSGAQGLKNAMLQVRTVRNDVASLLQTVYLAEITIQSLEDYEKGGVAGSTPLLPVLDVADMDSMEEGGNGDQGEGGAEERAELMNDTTTYSELPPAKRSKVTPRSRISITECTVCEKKFANPSPGTVFLCRTCRQIHTPEATPTQAKKSSSEKKIDPSTPTTRGRGRGNLSRTSCKLCGASFLYKRCLHRHIRENHTDLDLNNLSQYIQPTEPIEPPADTPTSSYAGGQPASGLSLGDEEDQQMLISISEEMGVAPGVISGGEEGGIGMISPQGEDSPGGGMDKYACTTCNKTFDRPYRLQRHIQQVHNPNRPKVTCHLCDKSFTRMDTLDNHMKCLHSNDRPFKCTFTGCPKRFPLQSALVHHLKVHMDGKPYRCNECEASFALQGEFRTHITEAHPDTKDLRCSECYKVFPSSAELGQHIKLEHRLECEVCMKTFSRLAYLTAHIEVHNGQSLFNCKFCRAGFDSEYAYKKHLKSHPKVPKASQSHPCTICDIAFDSTTSLMEHYRSDEHRDKMEVLGLEGTSILHTIEGELSPEIRSLVDEVTGSIGAAEVDERLMRGGDMLRAATVTIDGAGDEGYQLSGVAADGVKTVTFEDAGGKEYQMSGDTAVKRVTFEGVDGAGGGGGEYPGGIEGAVKRVTFQGVDGVPHRED